MNLLVSIILVFVSLSSLAASGKGFDEPLRCNGEIRLCDRKYNDVTYLMSHNAQSYQTNWLLMLLPGSNINDQTKNLEAQLQDGVRAMKMPVHFQNQQTYVCHGMGHWVKDLIKQKACEKIGLIRSWCSNWIENMNPCTVDPGMQPLTKVLKTIGAFLKENRNEVFTLFLEDDARDFKAIYYALKESDLVVMMHHQPENQSWPTLSEMVRKNKRLVVFVNEDEDLNKNHIQQFPELNSTHQYVWSTPYHFESVEELEQDGPKEEVKKSYGETTHGNSKNKLWLMQHFVTPALAGNENAAAIVNQTPFLMTRIQKYQKFIQTAPNFISVDFYDLPDPSSGVLQAVKQLNNRFDRIPASNGHRSVSF